MEQPEELNCLRCGHNWKSRTECPSQCPKCHTYNWDMPVNTIKERINPTCCGKKRPVYAYR